MFYQTNHVHNKSKLLRLEAEYAKAKQPAIKAMIKNQINRIKRDEAAFKAEQMQIMHESIYGSVEDTQIESIEIVEEIVSVEDKPKRGRKRKEQE